jgi:hypothetical protein
MSASTTLRHRTLRIAAAVALAGALPLVPATGAAPRAQASPLTDLRSSPLVGVLPSSRGVCPPNSTKYYVYLDNEDHDNANSRTGWLGGIVSDRNTYIPLCAVPGSKFRKLFLYRVNFAVVALGGYCPAPFSTVVRHHDDEDHDNANRRSLPAGSLTSSDRNTNLAFCWISTYDEDDVEPLTAQAFPDLGGAYGGFGPDTPVYSDSGSIHLDDEDDNNENRLSAPALPGLHKWLAAGRNTTYQIVRVH